MSDCSSNYGRDKYKINCLNLLLDGKCSKREKVGCEESLITFKNLRCVQWRDLSELDCLDHLCFIHVKLVRCACVCTCKKQNRTKQKSSY